MAARTSRAGIGESSLAAARPRDGERPRPAGGAGLVVGSRRGRAARGGVLRLLDGGDVEAELDLVGDEHVAAAEGLVERHAELAAAELTADLEADALVAPR